MTKTIFDVQTLYKLKESFNDPTPDKWTEIPIGQQTIAHQISAYRIREEFHQVKIPYDYRSLEFEWNSDQLSAPEVTDFEHYRALFEWDEKLSVKARFDDVPDLCTYERDDLTTEEVISILENPNKHLDELENEFEEFERGEYQLRGVMPEIEISNLRMKEAN